LGHTLGVKVVTADQSEGAEKMLKEILSTAVGSDAIDTKDVDTIVQEKAIAFPTDAPLYRESPLVVVCEAQKTSVKLRQSCN